MLAFLRRYSICIISFSVGLLLGAAIVASGYYFEHQVQHEQLLSELKAQQHDLEKAQKALAACQMEVQILTIGKTSLQSLTEDLQQQVADQEKDLTFYRKLMASETGKEGLDLNAWSLMRLSDNSYLLRLTFVQYAAQHPLMNASLEIRVLGRENQQPMQYAMRDLLQESEAESAFEQRLRFRYFQIVEIRFVLPEDFVAEKITLDAVPAARNAKAWQTEILWQVQEL